MIKFARLLQRTLALPGRAWCVVASKQAITSASPGELAHLVCGCGHTGRKTNTSTTDRQQPTPAQRSLLAVRPRHAEEPCIALHTADSMPCAAYSWGTAMQAEPCDVSLAGTMLHPAATTFKYLCATKRCHATTHLRRCTLLRNLCNDMPSPLTIVALTLAQLHATVLRIKAAW